MLRGLFKLKPKREPSLPEGKRVYAIGDVHGRRDLLDALLDLIRADSEARGPAEVEVLLLGDLIDRGADSAGVVARAMEPLEWATLRALKGNHEASLLDALDGDPAMARLWLKHGGVQALISWGLDPDFIDQATTSEIVHEARRAIPHDQRRFLIKLPLSATIGDYHFAHAGIRPGVKLDAQKPEDMLWIREEFLDSNRDHGVVVVHGHSVATEVQHFDNRIGIDTGAYASGRLTALGLEGTDRWFLQTAAAG